VTGKSRIRIALGVVAALALGAALLSLNYLNGMVDQIQRISTTDTPIAELGESLSIRFLEARRDEKNFMITLDSTYIQSNRSTLRQMNASIVSAYSYAPEYNAELDSLLSLMADYSGRVTLLVKTLQDDPRTLSRLQRQLKSYESEIQRLQQKGRITQDAADQLAKEMNLDVETAAAGISNDKAVIFAELRNGAEAIQRLTEAITRKARAALEKHAAEGVQQGIRAQRNTFTFLFLAVIIVVYLIVIFPHRLFLPITRISRTLSALERGEEEIRFDLENEDEFGQLSQHIDTALNRLRLFNQLKSAKITDGQRHLQRILDTMDEPVLFLSADFNILYVNKAGSAFWENGVSLTGQSIKNLTQLWEVTGDALENIRERGRTTISTRLGRRNLIKKTVAILPHITQNDRIETIVVIVK